MDDYEKYSAEAADVELSDFHEEQFKEFLEGNITAEDIHNMYNNEEERDWWENFRFQYHEYGDDRETMLEALRDAEKERAADIERDRKDRADRLRARGRRRKSGPQEHPEQKASLPEPQISRHRRGSGKAPRESANPIIRALGRFGRKLFGRDK